MAILAHDVCLRNTAVADRGDIVDIDCRSIHLADGEIGDTSQRHRRRVEMDVVLILADLCGASGQNDILRCHRAQYVDRRKTLGLKQLRVEVQHDGSLLAAIHVRNDCAWNGDKLRPNKIKTHVVQLLLGEPSAGEPELKNWYGGRA